MWQSFWHIIGRSFVYYPNIFSSNWFALGLVPIAFFLYSNWKELRGWRSMTAAQWKQSTRKLSIFVGFYFLVFLWAVATTIYRDHSDVLSRIRFWKDKAESQTAYVETTFGPAYTATDRKGNTQLAFFAENMPLDMKFVWTRTGESIAEDVINMAQIYLAPDSALATQKELIEKFKAGFAKRLKDRRGQMLEGPTLGYSDNGKTLWSTSFERGPKVTRAVEEDLWSGKQILFVVAAVSYKTRSGQTYEGHFCDWLQPLNMDYGWEGKAMPYPMPSVQMAWHICDLYITTVKQ